MASSGSGANARRASASRRVPSSARIIGRSQFRRRRPSPLHRARRVRPRAARTTASTRAPSATIPICAPPHAVTWQAMDRARRPSGAMPPHGGSVLHGTTRRAAMAIRVRATRGRASVRAAIRRARAASAVTYRSSRSRMRWQRQQRASSARSLPRWGSPSR